MTLTYRWYRWPELDVATLYAFLKLRSDIFVVEQDCVFSDLDDLDQGCEHLVACDSAERVLGYARLLPPGLKYNEPSIGRVVIAPSARGGQHGRALMLEAIAGCKARHPGLPILLWAQQRLEPFYASLGFVCCSEPELEDGILHIKMKMTA